MVHKSSIIPGISKFIDESVLAQYPANSMKRIILAGAVTLFLKQNEGVVESLTSNPLFGGLGIVHSDGMIDIQTVKEALKTELNKAGFMRLSIPMFGDIDFTSEDIDSLYKCIVEINTKTMPQALTSNHIPSIMKSVEEVY